MPNRLAGEKSPYLLQHKDNPVDWRPWGAEAFEAARSGDRPLLLSIGYSTCHWCHVMEKESFSDPEVAKVMNELFVCVKLDREERPDVDKVYMTAVQAMGVQGGWPLNVFLTPALRPFFGGTYFPPRARWGQPGWVDLLRRISELWKERRQDIEHDARRLADAVARHVAAAQEARAPAAAALDAALGGFKGAFDGEHAGFGSAPKFPMPAYQRLLLRLHRLTGDEDAARMAREALLAMSRGGIHDHLGGGFHRYSTDAQWRVPHFEKMLYDNAQLLENLAEALLVRRDPELERALRGVVSYLGRDLRSPEGGFYSAEDADSLPEELAGKGDEHSHAHKEEGAFYLWTPEQVRDALGGAAEAFLARYGVLPEGNALFDPHGELRGKSVLYEREPSALDEASAESARARLLARRGRRPRPGLDDKVLASWNGLALTGLSRACAATGDAAALELAEKAADFLKERMGRDGGKRLWHRWREGSAGIAGMAEDYAYVVQGLVDLYEAGFRPERLDWALTLADSAIELFAAEGGGLYQTAAGEAGELFARALDDHDGVEPAASSVFADACLRLHELTGRARLREFADRTLAAFGPRVEERPLSMPYLLCALERALGRPRLLVIAGLELPGGAELLAAARARLRPHLSLAGFTRESKAALARLVPAVEDMPDGARAAAYLCAGGACGTPLSEPAELSRRLDA